MSEKESAIKKQKAHVEGFEIELRLDCTVKIGDWDFVKPGVSSRIRFDSVPDKKQIDNSLKFINASILEPTMNDVIDSVYDTVNRQFGERQQ